MASIAVAVDVAAGRAVPARRTVAFGRCDRDRSAHSGPRDERHVLPGRIGVAFAGSKVREREDPENSRGDDRARRERAVREQLHRSSELLTSPGVKLISITATDLYLKSNYQDFQRYTEIDIAMAADAEATLPSLIEAVKSLITDDRKRVYEERGKGFAVARLKALDQARTEATYAWDASPISTARLCAELWAQIKDKDWTLASETIPWVSNWPMRLWSFDKHHQSIGGAGGHGIGYGAPAALGAALANKKHGRLTVTIQCDGDLMYAPGILWTSAHHKIPLLSIMHNNRGWHQELMHVQRMADRHNRGIDRAVIGTTITGPDIDFAKLAQSMGVHAEGPITDPKDLGPAIQRAIAVGLDVEFIKATICLLSRADIPRYEVRHHEVADQFSEAICCGMRVDEQVVEKRANCGAVAGENQTPNHSAK